MSNLIAKRFFVSGRVQGVYFRASTRAKAQELAVSGYARNLPDGRVEVLAIGALAAIESLEQWLWKGPPAAQVAEVLSEELELAQVREQYAGFVSR